MMTRLHLGLRRLADADALSLPAWLLLGFPSLLLSLAYLVGREGQTVGAALLWGLTAWGVMGLVWWLARLTWMSVDSENWRAALILPTYVLAAVARSLVMDVAARDQVSITGFAVVTMAGFSIAAAITVRSLRALEGANGRLEVMRDALAESDSRARLESAALRASARQVIIAAIERTIEDGESLRHVSDEVVRPLSHSLVSAVPEVTSPELFTPRRDARGLARAILDAGPIRPLTASAIVAAVVLPISYMLYGVPRFLISTALLWGCLVLIYTGAWLIPWRRLPVRAGMVLLVTVLFAGGFLAVTLIRALVSNVPTFPGGTVFGGVVGLLVGGLIAVVHGMQLQQRHIEDDLVNDSRRLAVSLATSQAEIRRERRHLSRILHGVVQPRLVARALRAQSRGVSVDIDEVVDEVSRLLGDDEQVTPGLDIVQSLRDISDVWAGSSDVAVSLDDTLDLHLHPDPALSRAVLDVASEAVNNAILRAGALWVDLNVGVRESSVTVTVTNPEPTGALEPGAAGLGSQLFDELTDAWSLEVVGGRVVFTADLRLPPRATTGLSPSAADGPLGVQ